MSLGDTPGTQNSAKRRTIKSRDSSGIRKSTVVRRLLFGVSHYVFSFGFVMCCRCAVPFCVGRRSRSRSSQRPNNVWTEPNRCVFLQLSHVVRGTIFWIFFLVPIAMMMMCAVMCAVRWRRHGIFFVSFRDWNLVCCSKLHLNTLLLLSSSSLLAGCELSRAGVSFF